MAIGKSIAPPSKAAKFDFYVSSYVCCFRRLSRAPVDLRVVFRGRRIYSRSLICFLHPFLRLLRQKLSRARADLRVVFSEISCLKSQLNLFSRPRRILGSCVSEMSYLKSQLDLFFMTVFMFMLTVGCSEQERVLR